ncbi:MAG TPA: hypothetical protein DCP28_09865, partial [Cytophagales bacterium]|nr:hypothetical protein [Cytophagales bacterium]
MSERDDLENYFRDGAGQFNQAPSDAVWDTLSAKLPAVAPWYTTITPIQWVLTGLVTVLTVYVVVLHWQFDRRVETLQQNLHGYQQQEMQWQLRFDTVYQELQILRDAQGDAQQRETEQQETIEELRSSMLTAATRRVVYIQQAPASTSSYPVAPAPVKPIAGLSTTGVGEETLSAAPLWKALPGQNALQTRIEEKKVAHTQHMADLQQDGVATTGAPEDGQPVGGIPVESSGSEGTTAADADVQEIEAATGATYITGPMEAAPNAWVATFQGSGSASNSQDGTA